MSDKRAESLARLRESLFDLYEQGGLELYLAGTLGLRRELVMELKAKPLKPDN